MNADWISVLRWIVGGGAAAIGLYVIGFNWATIRWNSRFAATGVDRHISSVPIVGPLMVCYGLAIATWPPTPHLLWCVLVDWPTATLPYSLWKVWRE